MRYTKISTRRRYYVSELPVIDVRSICNLDRNCLCLELGAGAFRFQINLKRHTLRYGGIWHTFECPSCGSGRFRLYLHKGALGCHKCLQLAYRNENKGKADRAIEMKWKLVHKLTEESNEHPSRPKGMHQRTYSRFMDRIYGYGRKADKCFFGFG